jgi:two-component system, cell cycle sensor histidine kinase and response regulator CckA
LIGREANGNAEVEDNVAEIEKAIQQGKHVVGSMLGYSNQNSPVDGKILLPELVEDTVSLLSRQFLSGITLDLQLDRDSPAIAVPRARLEQILLNLIVNAAEAMEGPGHLRIQVRSSEAAEGYQIRPPRPASKYVELVVADTGCGIAPDILLRVFDPFFTTKVSGASRGTGLGLSMVYTMAEQERLGIGVDTAPGKGAAFRIAIPVGPSTKEFVARVTTL